MSVTSYQLAEEHLWCCICLDVFTDPVTLPCGHNFCRSCIGGHLNFDPQRRCPMCKERVEKKQKLGVNTFISELAAQCRRAAGRKHAVTPGPSHDPPVGPKPTSLKPYLLAVSLLCLFFFFAFNLRFHHILSSWETQSLFASVEKSSESVCTEHGEPLEFFCKKDQVKICRSCRASRHRLHQVVPLKEQHEEKQAELWKTEARIKEMIWKRRLKIQELKRSVKLSEDAADQEVEFGVGIFSSLIQTLEKAQAELMETIEEKQNAAKKQAEGLISELDQEVLELVEKLSHSTDPVLLLQSLPVRNAAPPTKDWTKVSVCPVTYEGLTRTSLVRAVDQLTDNVREAMKKLQDAEMEKILQVSVDVTLDPDTAHPALVLSDDGKLVHCSDKWKRPPGDPEGPGPGFHVLGKQGFSCGRFYFDVQVKGKTAWTVGVVRGTVNKKIDVKLNPEHGCWVVRLQNTGEFEALDQSPVRLSVDFKPERLRVLVDHEEGLVSFYDVDAGALIFSFTGCSFKDKLFPFFSPGPSDGGRNAAPLIISAG